MSTSSDGELNKLRAGEDSVVDEPLRLLALRVFFAGESLAIGESSGVGDFVAVVVRFAGDTGGKEEEGDFIVLEVPRVFLAGESTGAIATVTRLLREGDFLGDFLLALGGLVISSDLGR